MAGINSYKKAYALCEEGLKIKQRATSAELLAWLIENYKIYSLNLTSKGITYHLKTRGYPREKKYASRPWIFTYKELDD